MKRLWSLLFLSLAALALVLVPRSASATDAEAAQLQALGKAKRYTVKARNPPSSIDMGGAAIFVNAPIADVRKIVNNYGKYKTFLHPFDQSRVLSKRKGVSEVYVQVPILHGAVHIWAVAYMSKPTRRGAEEVITSRFKRGNVDDFRAVWRMRAVDREHTVLKLELLVDPAIPFASSLVTKHLAISAAKGVTGVRNRAQAVWAARRPAPAPVATAVPDADRKRGSNPSPGGDPKQDANGRATSGAAVKSEREAPPSQTPAAVPAPSKGPANAGSRPTLNDVAQR